MEIWSLARFPEGEDPGRPAPPEVWECDDPRWPPIPAQDFSNIPRQQKGLHMRGFEYMRLSSTLEGHISNFERTGIVRLNASVHFFSGRRTASG